MEHATAPVGAGGPDPRPFLREAVAAVTRREALVPVLLLLILLTVTNIVILFHVPAENAMPSRPFLVAAAVRVLGLFVIALAILRAAAASPRPRWRLDGAFWLYTLVAPVGFAVSFLVMALVGQGSDLAGALLANLINIVILAPFAAWLTAIAVARPLAWNPLN